MLQKIFNYAQKIINLGPKRSGQVLVDRMKNLGNYYYWRQQALLGQAAHSWEDIYHFFDLNKFEQFFEFQRLRSINFVSEIYSDNINFLRVVEDANFFVKNGIQIFYNLHYFIQIDWHKDVNLHEKDITSDVNFKAHIFYKDIVIKSGRGKSLKKDIKVPWELSRFQHLFVLGKAYEGTGDKKYYDTFVYQINDWLDHNQYLLGVNWVCPMEVGLRALNWIIAFSFFRHANIDSDFWQRFTESLYDHLIYLEHNWEIYDSRTSNHYLSDLVGYLYLCWFFKGLNGFAKKLRWVHQEIVQEMDKQVFDEGTDYEGSTHYHQLVTELFYHAYLMFKEYNLEIPQNFEKKLFQMFAFIQWCTPANGTLISIGDNDSGKVLYYGLPKNNHTFLINKYGEQHFDQFGLSIIKNKKVHITLRHHSYNTYQPSGHFHNDVGSITLAVNGIPVFVDPGSYVYTSSIYWRNKFRSVMVHNTCYIGGVEPVELNDELFGLDLLANNSHEAWQVEHNLYKNLGLIFKRNINFDESNNQYAIQDEWSGTNTKLLLSCWNFTLGPQIEPKKKYDAWHLQHRGKTLVTLYAKDLDFQIEPAWVSFEYGKKIKSLCLRANKKLEFNLPTYIYLSLVK